MRIRALPFLLALALSACVPVATSTRPTGERPGKRYSFSTIVPLPPSANLATLPPDAPAPPPTAEPASAHMRVHMVDVGQGLAMLLEFTCAAVLVDVGGENNSDFDSERALEQYLNKFFVTRPDLHRTLALVVLTHPHRDHTDNAKLVAKNFTIQNVVTNGQTEGSGAPNQVWLHDFAADNKIPLFKVDADAVPAGGLTNPIIDPVRCADVDPQLSVLWGAPGRDPASWSARDVKSGNNYSVALRVAFGKAVVLSTGDMEGAALAAMVAKHAGAVTSTGANVVDSDVWQVSHHGSENGATWEFISATSPTVALLATGSPERTIPWSAWAYGHPRLKVIEMLDQGTSGERAPVEVLLADRPKEFFAYKMTKGIWATGWDGSVLVDVGSDGQLRIRTTK